MVALLASLHRGDGFAEMEMTKGGDANPTILPIEKKRIQHLSMRTDTHCDCSYSRRQLNMWGMWAPKSSRWRRVEEEREGEESHPVALVKDFPVDCTTPHNTTQHNTTHQGQEQEIPKVSQNSRHSKCRQARREEVEVGDREEEGGGAANHPLPHADHSRASNSRV
jgi:hypothetical protein